MAKKEKKAASINYEVEVLAPGFDTYDGEILSIDSTGVQINHKKPRSSKRINRFIPMDNIVMIEGVAGEEGTVVVRNSSADAGYAEGSIVESDISGMVKVEGERTYYIRSEYANASVVAE